MTQQPLEKNGSWLCWNGEVFGGLQISTSSSDTGLVLDLLLAATRTGDDVGIGLAAALSTILGPYAFLFWHSESECLYFGRDPMGRRSLLFRLPASSATPLDGSGSGESPVGQRESGPIVLTSVAARLPLDGPNANLHELYNEIEPAGVYCLSFASSSAATRAGHGLELKHAGTGWSIHLSRWPADLPHNAGKMIRPLSAPKGFSIPVYNDEQLAVGCLELLRRLSAAVKVRVTEVAKPQAGAGDRAPAPGSGHERSSAPVAGLTAWLDAQTSPPVTDAIDSLERNGLRVLDLPAVVPHGSATSGAPLQSLATAPGASVAVLFSGGLDSMVLAALAHAHVPADQPIDLINVCFSSDREKPSPDRLAALAGVDELRLACPDRCWQLILVDDSFQAAVGRVGHTMSLLAPAGTHMDFNIGSALWAAARGVGYVDVEAAEALQDVPAQSLLSAHSEEQWPSASRRGAAGGPRHKDLRYGLRAEIAAEGVQLNLSVFNKLITAPTDAEGLPNDGVVTCVTAEQVHAALHSEPYSTPLPGPQTDARAGCRSSMMTVADLSVLPPALDEIRKRYDELVASATTAAGLELQCEDSADAAPTASTQIDLATPPVDAGPALSTGQAAEKVKHLPARKCCGVRGAGHACLGAASGACPRSMCKSCCLGIARKAIADGASPDQAFTCPAHAERKPKDRKGPVTAAAAIHAEAVADADVAVSVDNSDSGAGGASATAHRSTDTASEVTAPSPSLSPPQSQPAAFKRYLVRSSATVLLLGIGADEQMAGYGRHRTSFRDGAWAGLSGELDKDVQRLWKRNLGRDDRVCSDNGREARFPYLDESVMALLRLLPLPLMADLRMPHGVGDKRILRAVGRLLGLRGSTCLVKRAIHFGSRIAKQSNVHSFGSNAKATGDAIFDAAVLTNGKEAQLHRRPLAGSLESHFLSCADDADD